MDKPDDIPQGVWDEAMAHSNYVGRLVLRNAPAEEIERELDLAVILARAILKAKADAIEQCAKVADDFNISNDWPHLTDEEINLCSAAQDQCADKIAQAIRKLKPTGTNPHQ